MDVGGTTRRNWARPAAETTGGGAEEGQGVTLVLPVAEVGVGVALVTACGGGRRRRPRELLLKAGSGLGQVKAPRLGLHRVLGKGLGHRSTARGGARRGPWHSGGGRARAESFCNSLL
jgi:hypothetical protein